MNFYYPAIVWRRFKKLTWDPHPGPHMLTEGRGCACTCSDCVKFDVSMGRYTCICPRCNQNCTAMGRLGSPDAVHQEQKKGYPRGTPRHRLYWR